MTREEAIKILNKCRDRGFERTTYTIEEYHTARDMAIKALEQEPCDNAVSRQDVLDLAKKGVIISNGSYESVCKAINEIPPVNQQEPKTDGDAISRDMALEKMADYVSSGYADSAKDFEEYSKIICQLPSVNPQPCEDAISRQAVLDKKELVELEDGQSFYCISPEEVETLPPVISQPCENAISRNMVLSEVKSGMIRTIDGENWKRVNDNVRDIQALPPVTPQSKHEDIAKAFQFGMAFGFGEKHDEMDRVMEEVKKAVTSQPKTGHWILSSDDDYEYCTCSECGYQNGENWMIGSQIKFCQECGAKMSES